LTGQTISHYRIAEKLGEGGMGVVYKAQDTNLDRTVALKFLAAHLLESEEHKERFLREAKAAASLDHPNICTVYEVGEADGRVFLAMGYIDGVEVRAKIKERPLKLDAALDISIQAAEGLRTAHQKGIVHRDIKSSNLMLTSTGQVKIMDFGLAQLMGGTRLTKTETMLGTPAYMSPEQAQRQATDRRSDIWSLGVVLYEMLTGRLPFEGEHEAAVAYSIIHQGHEPITAVRAGVPMELDRIVSKALAKNPAERYQHLDDMLVDLRALHRGTGSGAGKGRSAPGWKVIVPVCAAVLAMFAAGYYYWRRAPKLTDKDTLVLADFTNTTGDPVFDGALRQGLTIQLAQSPFLSLVTEERIQQALRLMGQPADARLTLARAKEICERTGSAAVLEGSVASLGSQYVLGLRATNCRTGNVLDEEQAQAARKEDVLNALSQIASKFRTRVGESLAMVEKHSAPLAEATTSSLEALKAFSAALKVLSASGDSAAVPFFKRAVEIDPKFAMAHAVLGVAYSSIGEPGLSVESLGKAYQLRGRASDAEKFFITSAYDVQVTGNLERAQQACELWSRTYPRDNQPSAFLAGMIYPIFGKYEKAVEEARKVIRLNPDFGIGYYQLSFNSQYLGRLTESENALQRASDRNLQHPGFLFQRYDIAFLKGDRAGMEKVAALGRGNPEAADWMADQEAFALAYSGRLQEAKKMARRAADLARQGGRTESAALYETGAALWEAFFGDAPAARRSAMGVLELSKGRDAQYGAAVALALAGDSSRSQILANNLERRFPEDTAVRSSYAPTLRALLALNQAEPAQAIDLLQPAVPYELGTPPSCAIGFFGSIYPAYVRGLAYLAAKRGAEAAAEFQKILDHRTIVVSDPIGALAHLQLGRAFALSGEKAKARSAYQDFLTLWKDADPGIPILQQAKAEFGKL